MKYIKTFENIKDFKIGDYVVCIDDSSEYNSNLKNNNIFEIEDIQKDYRTRQFKLIGVNTYWSENRFRLATPEEIEDYEIKNTAKKYNL